MTKQELKLTTNLKFWYQHQPTKENFNESLVPVAKVSSVEEFWKVYQHCKRPSSLNDNSYFYIFKENVKPIWEDPSNQNGGSFVLRFQKNSSDKVWEDIVLSFLAENAGENTNINGIRSKIRKDVQTIEIWVSHSENEEELERTREWIIEVTKLDNGTSIEFIKFNVE